MIKRVEVGIPYATQLRCMVLHTFDQIGLPRTQRESVEHPHTSPSGWWNFLRELCQNHFWIEPERTYPAHELHKP